MATDLGSLPCSWSGSIFVILPSVTVTRTWALPYCVGTTSPVAVRVPLEPLLPEGDAPAPAGVVAVAAGVAALAAALGSAGSWGLKLRTAARPAAVAVRTMGARRMLRRRRTRGGCGRRGRRPRGRRR